VTADGVPYSKIAVLHGRDVLATTVLQTCIRYQSRTKTCQFCAIGQSLAAGRTIELKTPAQLAEVAKAAVELDGVSHMVMTTGTPPGRDRGAAILAESAAAVKAAVDLLSSGYRKEYDKRLQPYSPWPEIGASLPAAEIANGLEAGTIDLALGYFPDLKQHSIFQQSLFSDTFTCLIRADHPVRSPRLSLRQFLQLEHAVVRAESRTEEVIERFLVRRRIQRRVVLTTPHFASVPPIVAQIVAAAMAKDPARRFHSPVQLADALGKVLEQIDRTQLRWPASMPPSHLPEYESWLHPYGVRPEEPGRWPGVGRTPLRPTAAYLLRSLGPPQANSGVWLSTTIMFVDSVWRIGNTNDLRQRSLRPWVPSP
jgi:hypothetical protein